MLKKQEPDIIALSGFKTKRIFIVALTLYKRRKDEIE